MASSTGHVRIQTRLQNWTRVHILTCLVKLTTGHRSLKERVNKEDGEIIKKNLAHVMRFDIWFLVCQMLNI